MTSNLKSLAIAVIIHTLMNANKNDHMFIVQTLVNAGIPISDIDAAIDLIIDYTTKQENAQ